MMSQSRIFTALKNTRADFSSSNTEAKPTAEHEGAKLAVSKIRAAIAGMSIANNDFKGERFVVRRRLSSEEMATAAKLVPTGWSDFVLLDLS